MREAALASAGQRAGPVPAVTVDHMGTRSAWLERRVIAYAHQGGAWESPSSTLHAIRAGARGGGHGDRARRPCHRRRRTGGLPRRHRGQDHAAIGDHRFVHARGAAVHGLLVLVDPRGGRDAGSAGRRLPLPGTGAGRPLLRHRHAARGARGVPRRRAQPRHQANGAGGDPLRGVAGEAAEPNSGGRTT